MATADGAACYGLDNAWRDALATIAAAIRACQDPGFGFMSQVTMAAWGQRR